MATRSQEQIRSSVMSFFTDPTARRDSDDFLRSLSTTSPIFDAGQFWLISGFEEVCRLSANVAVRTFPAKRGAILPISTIPSLASSFSFMLPMVDGPDHARLRSISARAFAPRRVAQLTLTIENIVDSILDQALTLGDLEVVSQLSVPLPVAIASEILDVPREDRDQVFKWALLVSQQILAFDQSAAQSRAAEVEIDLFLHYLGSLCASRRGSTADDMISVLMSSYGNGDLSVEELQAYVLMLFINGLETLTSGVTVSVWELTRRQELHQRISGDRAFAQSCFNEALRLYSPIRFSARVFAEDLDFDGFQFKEGEVAVLFYSAANRDLRQFEVPESFDPERPSTRHLAFGHGPHHCLGREISLSAGSIVLERLARLGLKRQPVTVTNEPKWSDSLAYSTLDSLSLHFGA